MEDIKTLIWNGSINAEILLSNSIVIPHTALPEKCLHIRLSRESYLPLFFPFIVNRLKNHIRQEPKDLYYSWWLEDDGVPIPWHYPIGVVYDLLQILKKGQDTCSTDDNTLTMWKLTLCKGEKYPEGIIPLIDGLPQIVDYWRHQWKQACFVLNGSAKRVMSLSIENSDKFWHSIPARSFGDYQDVRNKIITMSKAKNIPVRIWKDTVSMLQLNVPYGEERLLTEVLELAKAPDTSEVWIQGISIPLNANLIEVYDLFSSLDGFLYMLIR